MSTKQTPRRGRPPSSDGRATQERILDAALEIFAERGFGGATVRQIAAKVGVSDPALYAHFKGKQAIFDALMREAGPDLLGVVADDKPLNDMSARTAIPKVFGAIVLAWTTPRARAFTSLMLRMGPEGIGSALRDVSERLQPVFSAWQARGELRRDIPTEVTVWQVIGPLSGLRMSYLNGDASEADVARAITLANAHLAQIVRSLTLNEKDTQ